MSRHRPYELCDCPKPFPDRLYHCAADNPFVLLRDIDLVAPPAWHALAYTVDLVQRWTGDTLTPACDPGGSSRREGVDGDGTAHLGELASTGVDTASTGETNVTDAQQ